MDHAFIAMTCVAAVAGHLMLLRLYLRTHRKLRSAEATLDAKASDLHDLVAENIEMGRRLDELKQTELEFFALRREHARTSSALEQLARIEAGLRLELARLNERRAAIAA